MKRNHQNADNRFSDFGFYFPLLLTRCYSDNTCGGRRGVGGAAWGERKLIPLHEGQSDLKGPHYVRMS